jgi:hypothetical protein
MEGGIGSLAAILPAPAISRLPSATDRMAALLEEVEFASNAPAVRSHGRSKGPILIGHPAAVTADMLQASEALGRLSRQTFQMKIASLEKVAMKRSIEHLRNEVSATVGPAFPYKNHDNCSIM